ncbi:MFS transporter [Goodfellowiella coeruleoviolacea]|uniref:MFS transporter n=1 Tax=Goodfellowiella coeruleoviolacea TaxID=334858 RepID=UPI0020A580B6|nr:MFS transporter [Goodfellowiella coeruleoviolacea]
MSEPTPRRGLGSRYYLLFTAYLVSNAGTWLYRLTLPLLVLHLTGSALQTAALYVLEYGPFLLLSLPGGVFADRFDRKRLLIAGDAVAGVVALALAVFVSLGVTALPVIYLVAFVLACVEPIYHPAFQGLLPDVVAEDELDRANALLQSSDNILSLAGPVLAGGLVALVGYEAAIYVDAGSFVVSALVIAAIRIGARGQGGSGRGRRGRAAAPARFSADLREAMHYITRGNRTLLAGSLLFTGTNFAIWLVQANLVYYLSTYLHLSSSLVGVVFAAQGAGALLGSLLAPRVIRWLGNGRTIAVSTMTAGLLTALLAVARDVVSVSLVSAVVFALGSMNVVSWFTLRQRIVPRHLLGRVVAATRMLAFSSIPVASAVAGGMEDALHNMYLVIVIGAVLRFAVGAVGSRTSLVRPVAAEPGPDRPATAEQS